MKKFSSTLVATILSLAMLTSCGTSNTKDASSAPSDPADTAPKSKIVIGATPTPHAEILEVAKKVLLEQGYELEIKEFVDYVQPNLALDSKDLDANFFQHQPYLDDFNAEHQTDLVSIAQIHYEPFGIYAGKTASLADLPEGATIAVPNDTSNEARALLLLEAEGLISLTPGSNLKTTINDITDNPKKLQIKEIEAAQISRSLQDVDLAVMNGNYALQAGLNAGTDALAVESEDSVGGSTFPNIVVVRASDENREDLKALIDAIKSDPVKKFIEEKYQGAVIPLF